MFAKSAISNISLFLTVALVLSIPFYSITTVQATGNESTAQTDSSLNALDFGVSGDGLQDDSRALQRAIDEASSRNIPLIIPPSDTHYLIRNTLIMRSNTHIIGYGATLFMPSSPNPMRFIGTDHSMLTSNITIEGITLKSTNDRAGAGYHTGSLTSNIVGIFLQAVENIRLNDITMDNVKTGLKFAWSHINAFNRNIQIDNLQVFNSNMSFYANTTETLIMTNSVLDASAGATHFLHSAYVSGNTENFTFDNVKFINTPGGGVAIANNYTNMANPKNIVVRNSIVDNAIFGVVASNVENLNISGLKVSNYGLAFNIWNSSRVYISNVDISRQGRTLTPEHNSAFTFFNVSNSNISNVKIDAMGKTGRLFHIAGTTENFKIDSIHAQNLNDNSLLFANINSLVSNLIFENSRIEWSSTTHSRISLRGNGSNAVFRNNTFINRGNPIGSLSFNTAGTNILFENNRIFRFGTIPHPTCQSRTLNNTNNTRIFQID